MANLRVTSNVNDLASQISGLMLHPLGLETPLSRPATQCLRTQAIRSRRNSHGARKGTHHFEAVMKISPGIPSLQTLAVRYSSWRVVADGKSLGSLSARLRAPEICSQNATIQNERSVHN
jgi:hypothetical protein